MMASWRQIKGAEPGYEVSSQGQVRYLTDTVKLSFDGRYYKARIVLTSGESVQHRVHRLVASAFVEGYKAGLIVNHIDEDKTNNNSSNLEWCTCQHNNEHSFSKTYRIVKPCGKEVTIFNLSKFCRKYNLDSSCMSKVSNGTHHKHKGFICRRIDE